MLRISLRLVHGQTGPRRVSKHTPAEVVAQGGDTERVVQLADNLIDQFICGRHAGRDDAGVRQSSCRRCSSPARWWSPGWPRRCSGRGWSARRRRTVAARAAFATALVSSLSAARTVKLAGATAAGAGPPGRPGRASAATGSAGRSPCRCGPGPRRRWSAACCRSAAWALYLAGGLSAGATLVAVSTLGAARWFAWTTASLVSQLPVGPGVDPAHGGDDRRRPRTRRPCPAWTSRAGTAPAPPAAPRHPLRRLELRRLQRRARGRHGRRVRDVDLTVDRGQLVLVVGPGRLGQVVAAAGAGRHRAPHRRAALERRAGHRAGAVPAPQPGRLRRRSCPGCSPARSPTTSARPRGGRRRARCPPPSSTTTWPPPAAGSGCSSGTRAPGSPAASCSGWRWPGRWPRGPSC